MMTQTEIIIDGAPQSPRRRWLWLLAGLILVVLLGGAAFVLWALTPAGELMPQAQQAMQDDARVSVTQNRWTAFIPNATPPEAGFILYPGARVPPEAYAPLARRIAQEGFIVVVAHPFLNFALLDSNFAHMTINHYAPVQKWVVGGHSLGGVAAASFAAANPDKVEGLVLLASFPSGAALAGAELDVLSIYGTNDGLTSIKAVEESARQLPNTTQFIAIEGGNHSQFGAYGLQARDNAAHIPRDAQLEQTATAIIALLQSLAG